MVYLVLLLHVVCCLLPLLLFSVLHVRTYHMIPGIHRACGGYPRRIPYPWPTGTSILGINYPRVLAGIWAPVTLVADVDAENPGDGNSPSPKARPLGSMSYYCSTCYSICLWHVTSWGQVDGALRMRAFALRRGRPWSATTLRLSALPVCRCVHRN